MADEEYAKYIEKKRRKYERKFGEALIVEDDFINKRKSDSLKLSADKLEMIRGKSQRSKESTERKSGRFVSVGSKESKDSPPH